jgi:ankyrin repeat protein
MLSRHPDDDIAAQELLLTNEDAPSPVLPSCHLTDLPVDVLGLIATHLPPQDIAALSAVSRQVNQTFMKGRAHAVWGYKLRQHFPLEAMSLINQQVTLDHAAFVATFQTHYGALDARTRWLLTLAAEGDVSRLTEGRALYAPPPYRPTPPLYRGAKSSLAPMTLDEMLKWHYVRGNSNVVSTAGRQSHQPLLDYGYALAQARHHDRCAESVSDALNDYGMQLIHYAAAMNQSKDEIFSLLKAGADVDAPTLDGSTPLALAASNGHTACVERLLAQGAAVDAAAQDGSTPIALAIKNGHTACVERLLAQGAAVDGANWRAFTPLYLAVQEGSTTCVELLLAKGAAVDGAAQDGSTPLAEAAFYGKTAFVEQLLAQGAVVDAASWDGLTPLAFAAKNGHTACVERLLAQGAAVDAAALDGSTPLALAAFYGHTACVERLLAQGAAVDAINQDGWTILDIAMSRGQYPVALHLYVRAIALRDDHHYLRSVSMFGRTFTGVGKSAGEKKQAANALLRVVNGEADVESLKPHAASLANGQLGKIAKGLGFRVSLIGNAIRYRL